MSIDDRVARALLENNIMVRLSNDEGRISLLEKLAAIKSVDLQTLPVPGVTPVSPFKKIFMEDDFLSTSGIIGFIEPGSLSWIPFNIVTDLIDPFVVDANHPGVATLESSSGGDSLLTLVPLPLINSFDNIQFIMRFDNLVTAGDVYRIGILPTSSPAQEGVYFQFSYGDTNWQTVTDDGVSQTINDSGIAFDNTKWIFLQIRRKSTDVFEFLINQSLVATHSTNITTSDFQYPTVFFNDFGYNTFNVHFDYFSMELATILQRWD